MMLNTKHDLPIEVRTKVVDLLNQRVADSIDLVYQAKQAHWNVKGMSFGPLHQLFDRVYDTIRGHTDDLAERLVQLGGIAEGTVQAAARNTSLNEYPLNLLNGEAHLEALSSGIAQFARNVHQNIQDCDDLGDLVTSDLFTEISHAVDELLWMVEAHLQGDQSVMRQLRGKELRKAAS